MENKSLVVSKEIDKKVAEVLNNKITGFEKAFIVSSAISTLRESLSTEFMKPIMSLQGSRLGFLTDKDKSGGYPEKAVKDCIIDAVLLGLQPTGNHFNIIAGNMYPTREGFGHLLTQVPNLRYNLEYPEVNLSEKGKVSHVTVKITWTINGDEAKKQSIRFPIKSNAYTSEDALIGKAERKSRRWLFNTIKGTDVSDGDVEDIPHVVINPKVDPDLERQRLLLNDLNTQEDFDFARSMITDKVILEDLDLKEIEFKKANK